MELASGTAGMSLMLPGLPLLLYSGLLPWSFLLQEWGEEWDVAAENCRLTSIQISDAPRIKFSLLASM